MYNVEIDMKGVNNIEDVIGRFYDVLQLPKNSNYSSLNAWYDWMSRLDSDSKIISRLDPIPDHIHLVIKNYDELGKFGEHGLIFLMFLVDLTDNHPEWRGEGALVNIKITFEVHHGDY